MELHGQCVSSGCTARIYVFRTMICGDVSSGTATSSVYFDDISCLRLDIPTKISEDYLRFLCPLCSEFNTAINPSTNLARCFRCQQNFNPIDMVMTVKGCSFLDAVKYLSTLL